MFDAIPAVALLPLVLSAGVPYEDGVTNADIRESIVKIHCTRHYPDLSRPWTRLSPDQVSGTGVVIEGNRILTNAHILAYARQIFVAPFQSADKLRATPVGIAPGIDLAVLQLDDDSFFSDHPPVPLADDLPKIGDAVNAYGFPIGGEALSMTKGIVSRIEFGRYYYGTRHLRIQIDAALNPGNSGGPAVSDGEVTGLIFSGIKEAENIGYVIPAEEIRAFLHDIEDGSYDGRPQLFDSIQTLQNPALRAKLGLDKNTTGVMVPKACEQRDCPLRPWDVITAIGGHDIDNAGMVRINDNLRLSYRYLVPSVTRDGAVPLCVLRDRRSIVLTVPVRYESNQLVKFLAGEDPSYFIFGPLVFTPVYERFARRLSAEYLIRVSNPIATRGGAKVEFEGEELVVVPSPLFPHPIAQGYKIDYPPVVATVNGIRIKNLRHLVETIRDLTGEFVAFEWADSGTETMVFRLREITDATEEILQLNGIRAQYSADLRDVWRSGNDVP